MQTIYINSAPIQPEPAGTHPHLFWFLVIPFTIALVTASIFLTQFYFGPPATLQVTTTRGTGSVKIDNGSASPVLFKKDLTPINHQVTISDDAHAAFPWKTQVILNSGALTSIDLDLGPTSDFTSSVILSLSRGSDLNITTAPDQASVSLDGDDLGKSPINRRVPGPGSHTVTIKKDGYLPKTFQINVVNGFGLTSSVTLFKNPSFQLTIIKSEPIKSSTSPDLDIISRDSSSLSKISGSLAKTTTQAWTSATFINLDAPDEKLPTSSIGWLEGLYYHSLIHLKLPDLPFQYFIDESGKFYEGRAGGKDSVTFDPTSSLESAASAPTLTPGIVYVGYLGAKGSITAQASDSFEKLVAFLGRTGPAAAVTQVKILPTPNGFLRVRKSPSTSASEVARVKPGETYDLVSQQTGWYEIKLNSGGTGWISSDYAQKI